MDNISYLRRLIHQLWLGWYSPAAIALARRGGGGWDEHQDYMAHHIDKFLGMLHEEKYTMNGRKNKGFIQNIKFVDLELTTEQKGGFKEWNWSDEDSLGMVEEMGTDGYKFGTRYDRTNGSWIVSITCAENGHANYGYCLSARGKSFLHALAVVLYKHCIVLRGEWTKALPDDENDGGWG